MSAGDFLTHIRLCTLNFFMPRIGDSWSRGSAFAMVIKGEPTLVTAGHVIHEKSGPWFLQLNPISQLDSGFHPLIKMELGPFYYLKEESPRPGSRGYADFALCLSTRSKR